MFGKIFDRMRKPPLLNITEGEYAGKHEKIFAERARKAIYSGMSRLGNEATETREMASSFFRLLAHKLDMEHRREPPTEEEVLEAIEQLKDVGRLSVFTTAVILPGGAVSLLGLEMLARKFGIRFTFVPSSFRKNGAWKQPAGKRTNHRSHLQQQKGRITDVTPLKEQKE